MAGDRIGVEITMKNKAWFLSGKGLLCGFRYRYREVACTFSKEGP